MTITEQAVQAPVDAVAGAPPHPATAALGADAGLAVERPPRPQETLRDRVLRWRELRDDVQGGDPAATRRQHAKGKLTARERIALLLDEGSLVEFDLYRRRQDTGGKAGARPHTDGVITGSGTVHGRRVFFYAQDFRLFGGSLGGIPQMLTTWFNIQLDLPWQNDGTPWTIDTQSISFHTDGVAVTGYRNTKPLGPPAGCTLVAICGPQVEAQCDSMRAGEHLVLRRLAAAGNAINVPYTPQNQDNLLGHSYAYDPGVSPSQSYQYLACITSDPNKPDYTDCTPSPLSVTVSQGACSVGGGGGPNCGVPGKPKCNSVGIDPTPP